MTEARRGLMILESTESKESKVSPKAFKIYKGPIEKVSLFFNLGCIYRIYLRDLKGQGKGKWV